jgi:hypothetical protein
VAGSPPAPQDASEAVPSTSVTPNPELDVPFTLNFSVGKFEFQGAGKQIELMSGPFVVLRSASRDRLTAYNASNGATGTYTIPEGVIADPFVSPGMVTLDMQGESIDEIAAFGARSESWSVQELEIPISGNIPWYISGELAVVVDGRYVYGFSGPLGTWDVLERQEGSKGDAVITADSIVCDDEDHVYVFGIKTGRWDTIEVE